MKKYALFSTLIFFTFTACRVQQKPFVEKKNPIETMMDSSSVLSHSFSGLMLYDINEKRIVFEKNADRYFTPASNTKTYTLYASLKLLGDSIPALRYIESNDSLIFWGTGDPTFLNPKFKNEKTFPFLKAHSSKKLYFSDGNFTNETLGNGWSWDDYNDAFQTEISPLPMYGNLVSMEVKKGEIFIQPTIFQRSFFRTQKNENHIVRTPDDNQFWVSKQVLVTDGFKQALPMKTSSSLTQQLLMDTLKTNVDLLHIPVRKGAKTLFSVPVDTVYRRMMAQSDNMLAEHLLLLCGAMLSDTLNSQETIQKIIPAYLADLPDAPKWKDGSGISRYNLFTPRTNVALLKKMYAEFPEERLFSLMAIGGKTGTLKHLYKGEKSYVFAKSGSMSGVYNQSGYLITKTGKRYIFSFMNNNFNGPISAVSDEVEKIITWVYLHQ